MLDIERAAPLRYRTMENKLREIDDTGAETFLTSCSDCRRTFDDAQAHFTWNKTPHSLLELVANNLDRGGNPNMSAQTIVVDPVTRIEGHLRIEAQFDGSVITQASSSGTMVRGIEIILQGRDPRDAWAFAQRICGVCTLVHGIASVRAVEDALKYAIPANAQLIRNLMIATQFVHDHVMHFYHLHALDWVDVVSALKADPKATSTLAQSISSYARSSPGYFADVQDRVKKLVESGQLGIFANAYWGNPGYKLPPEANLMAVAHYLDALAWQREIVQLQTIFGGKNPHPNCAGRRRALGHQRSCRRREPAPPRSTWSACRRWPRSSSRCEASSTRSICRTCWRSPRFTRTGSRPATARASATS